MDEILLPDAIYEEMVAHVAGLWPEEACGLLAGRDGRAERLYAVENMRHSPTAYEMEPAQQVRAMIDIEAGGLELLGIFHSHPHGPARPSPSDVAQALYPDAAHVIISLVDRERPSARAFLIRDGQAREIVIRKT